MPSLRAIDLSGSKLNVVQANALREADWHLIQSDSEMVDDWVATISSSSCWWLGRAATFIDLPNRTVVYPSYGVY